ncbi:MAG TPA: IS21 family transposase, partial [Mycobacterium sp.]|nr:IS21 family transposase [Mycobacterium sp.]
MLTWEDDVEVHALHKRGWTIAAIARHTGRDRKTIRDYLSGKRTPGVRARPGPDPFEPFVDYITARLIEDPHLWARTLLDELEQLGFPLSYQSLTRNIRARKLRPDCQACRTATGRPNAVIPHAPGDETQWDWLELPNPPESWGWGKTAHLLVGSLAHSGKWRAKLSPAEDQPLLVEALDCVTRALGGVTRVWRFDRMATVCDPGSGRVSASFAGVAKHYGVAVAICPPRRGNRKGVVEKVNHTAAQRWWRTLADDLSVEQAQASVDRFAAVRGDTRLRATADGRSSVAVVAKTEPLAPVLALPYPVIVSATRTVSRQALVSYRGNRYSVPPELACAQVVISHPVGGEFCDIATVSGIVIARHRIAADGLGVMVRDSGHVIALDTA